MIDLDLSPPTEMRVRERLYDVIDPELGINIMDLGLVYDVGIDDREILVTMTMTTPACPLGPYIEQEVEFSLADIAAHRMVTIDFTFDPPWSPEMITPTGQRELGWTG